MSRTATSSSEGSLTQAASLSHAVADRCETKTLDNVFVNVVVSVQYQVVRDNIYDAL